MSIAECRWVRINRSDTTLFLRDSKLYDEVQQNVGDGPYDGAVEICFLDKIMPNLAFSQGCQTAAKVSH